MTAKVTLMAQHGLPETITGQQDLFSFMMQLSGERFRKVCGRETLKVSLAGQSYFIKKHFGVGWKEIFKNLISAKNPVLSARNEWEAILQLDKIGILTTPLVAYGVKGWNPATRQSFVLTRDLGEIITLEDLTADWLTHPPELHLKRQLIIQVATLASVFHQHGMCHRDFYLCHFSLLKSDLQSRHMRLHLMDLHRVEIDSSLPRIKRLKDLAGLYFSAMHIGLTRQDIFRFLKVYTAQPLHSIEHLSTDWQWVVRRAIRLDRKFQRKKLAGVAL